MKCAASACLLSFIQLVSHIKLPVVCHEDREALTTVVPYAHLIAGTVGILHLAVA